MVDATEGRIMGRPTLLVTYRGKLDAQAVMDAIGGAGYPLDDVSVYYRVAGTDQVIDATTGQVAAGQSLSAEESAGKAPDKLDTLVLLHPDGVQFAAVQGALAQFGDADVKYAEATIAAGYTDSEAEAEGAEGAPTA